MALMTKLDPGVSRKGKTQRTVDLIRDWKVVGKQTFPQRRNTPNKSPSAPAFYVGWQVGSPRIGEGVALYTLTEAIPGHCQWSTVSGNTLEAAGFSLPSGTVAPQDLSRS